MTHHWDEFSKSVADESLPRRESLRRLGFLFAGALLSPLGVGTAWARGSDPCRAFCRSCNKSQQDACLAACQACNHDTSRLAGSCGSYTCCSDGQLNCGRYCTWLGTDRDCNYCGHDCASTGRSCCLSSCVNLADDFYNCGACRNACDAPGPFENGACIEGRCEYWCVEGAVVCDGACSLLDRDANNCGACGNVCGDSTPYCNQGTCNECPPGSANCGYGYCSDLAFDNANCGACGNVCGGSTPYCSYGTCTCTGIGGTICGGACVNLNSDSANCGACGLVCPSSAPYCNQGECSVCGPGETLCGPYCYNLSWDAANCGACGHSCGGGLFCSNGICTGGNEEPWY